MGKSEKKSVKNERKTYILIPFFPIILGKTFKENLNLGKNKQKMGKTK
jgi:hypothetical protein